MSKRILSIFIVCMLLTGCDFSSLISKNKVPKGNSGTASQQDSSKTRIVGKIDGEIELPEDILLDSAGKPRPPLKLRIDGVDAEVPAGTKGKFKMSVSGSESSDTFTSLSSTWKLNSAPVQLFVFGGIMVAVASVLLFLSMWTIGIPIGIAGFALIACGVMINNYPWVILIVLGVALVSGVYYIYIESKKRKLLSENENKDYVLRELTKAVSKLPDDVLESYIKKPLRESDNSGLIREITMEARLKNK